jgi:hypothetical protein
MKVFGQLEKATLENLAANPGTTITGHIYFNTVANAVRVYNGGWKELADLSSTQTITGKTFGDAITLTEVATPSTPAAGLRRFYTKSDGKLYHLGSDGIETPVGSGSGGGSVNYLTAGDAESLTGAPVAFADGATLVDGTGGSPTATIARTATNPLSGTNSWLYTPGALGNGFSFDFTLPRGQRTGVQQIDLNYEIGGTGFADGDIEFWVLPLDGSSTTLIQPAPYKLSNASGPQRHQPLKFQATVDGSSYRLIGYQKTATSTYTLKFEAAVGPQSTATTGAVTMYATGTPAAAAQNAAIIFPFTGNSFDSHGAYNATTGTFTAPLSGYYRVSAALRMTNLGVIRVFIDGTAAYFMGLSAADGFVSSDIRVNAGQAVTVRHTGASGTGTNGECALSIERISAPVSTADAGDGRVVAAKYKIGTNKSPAANSPIDFDTKSYDLTASVTTGSSWKFTAPISGVYAVSVVTQVSSAVVATVILRKNGSNDTVISSTSTAVVITGATKISLNAGDYIDIVCDGAVTFNTNSSISVDRVSGPTQVAASETVAAKYTSSAGQSIANGATPIVDFATKAFDTHNAVTTGASWKFTAPMAGKYRISTNLRWANSLAWTSGSYVNATVYKTGSADTTGDQWIAATGTFGQGPAAHLSTVVSLNAGDYLDVRASHGESSARALVAAGTLVWVSIERIGS